MKIFLDTADTEEVRKYFATGLVDGVTTNPSLIRKAGRDPEEVYQEMIDIGVPDVSMEVVGTVGEMYNDGVRLAEKFGAAATIKLPCTPDGLMVCKDLTKLGIKTNVTLVFSVAQAVMAMKAGATYLSPFVGRCNDNSFSGVELVRAIATCRSVHGMKTEVLAASLRDAHHVSRCFMYGSDIVTMPTKVFNAMYDSVLTREGLAIFQRDYEASLEALNSTEVTVF